MLINQGERPARAEQALTRAFALRERLTFRERKLTETSYYSDARGALDSAVTALQSLLAEYPNDSWAWNNLGVLHETTGNEAEAERGYSKAAALEPENILAWGNIFTLRIGAGRFDSAAATLQLMKNRFPAGPGMDFRQSLLLLGRRDFALAEDSLRAMTARYQANAPWHDAFLNNLAGALAIRGKLAEADRMQRTLSEERSGRGDATNALEVELLRVIPIALYREDPRAAKLALDAVLRSHPLERLQPQERPLLAGIYAATSAGDLDLANRLLEEFSRNRGNIPGRAWGFLLQLARGEVLSLKKESLPEGLAAFRKAAAVCAYCAEAPLGLAFERAGMADSALAHYQHWADVGEQIWEAGVYYHWAPLAYVRLGELYQAKGDTARAVDYYGRFTELWREADPEFQPKVKEVRLRIADLKAEPRRP
jgi:eukaryotic-like serine/threonine-protein kinase